MCLAKNIKYLRKSHNLSQEDLANKLGYKSFTTIQKWESGVAEPPIGKVRKIADLFNVNINDLANGDLENPDPHNSSPLSEKEEKDVAKTMSKLKDQLRNQQGLMFDGEPMDEETIELLLEELERQERIVKLTNRKYIPKKYRKD